MNPTPEQRKALSERINVAYHAVKNTGHEPLVLAYLIGALMAMAEDSTSSHDHETMKFITEMIEMGCKR